jgi:hypothetical protein
MVNFVHSTPGRVVVDYECDGATDDDDNERKNFHHARSLQRNISVLTIAGVKKT